MPHPRPDPQPTLPAPTGPLTRALFARWDGQNVAAPTVEGSVWDDDDAQLALYCCYELHYRGFHDVDDNYEWDPWTLGLRAQLEQPFTAEIRRAVPGELPSTPGAVDRWLLDLATAGGGPSLSSYMAEHGSLDEFREFCIHRSAYQLKEADPHTWGLPRLHGPAKAAMVEIQADEYGNGTYQAMHAVLFADTMRTLDLDSIYGAYLPRLPAVTLATCNLVTMFGLHRRWRGALVGHLALFEMTSIGPMGRYSQALRRLGIEPAARHFYDVHVQADATHQRIARTRMVQGLLATEPALAPDIAFGAAALVAVEARLTSHLLDAWHARRSSLRPRAPITLTTALSP